MVTNIAIVNTVSIDMNVSSQSIQTSGLFFVNSADPDLAITQAVKTQETTQAVKTQQATQAFTTQK